MKKRCNKCLEIKLLKDFFKDKSKRDGFRARCKVCENQRAKNYRLKNKELLKAKADRYYEANKDLIADRQRSYRRLRKNKLKSLYNNQFVNSKRRGHKEPNYSFTEFSGWAIDNGFNSLYDSWKDSGFDKNLAPSGDRLDSFKPYSLSNLQLVTWKENKDNYIDEIIEKCNECVSFYIEKNVLIIEDWNDNVDLVLKCIHFQIEVIPNQIIYADSDEEWFKLKVNSSGYFVSFEQISPDLSESIHSKNDALNYVLKESLT